MKKNTFNNYYQLSFHGTQMIRVKKLIKLLNNNSNKNNNNNKVVKEVFHAKIESKRNIWREIIRDI